MESSHKKFTIALLQPKLCRDKAKNIEKIESMISKAVSQGAQVVVLPEMWVCDYNLEAFRENAEPIDDFDTNDDSIATKAMSKAAKDNNVYIIGGSIPEKVGEDTYYNTCACFNKSGEIVTKHRKMHLFDLEIPGKVKFHENEVFSKGSDFCIFETEYCKFGVGVCYDVRFPDYAQLLCREKGAEFLVYPAAYPIHTGTLHWDVLRKIRALDNQAYFTFCSAARPVDDEEMYQTYGHSSIVDPWGKVIVDCEHDEELLISEIDIATVYDCRAQIPCYTQRRKDLYTYKIL